MSPGRLPSAFHHVVKTLPDIAYADLCGDRARAKMLIGGNADAPILSCILRRDHEGRHLGGVRTHRRWFMRTDRWSCWTWGR